MCTGAMEVEENTHCLLTETQLRSTARPMQSYSRSSSIASWMNFTQIMYCASVTTLEHIATTEEHIRMFD